MFRQLFYLQRSDRRTLLFCILLGVFALVTVTVLSYCGASRSDSTAKKQTEASDSATRAFGASGSGDGSQWRYDEGAGSAMAERFAFDPNTADSTQLLRLGLKPWQVRSIYRYRAKGGVFSEPADFARVYGLTLKQYRELEPYIRIGRDYQPPLVLSTRAARHMARRLVRLPVITVLLWPATRSNIPQNCAPRNTSPSTPPTPPP